MMRTQGYGVSLKSPLSLETTEFMGCSFVHDTDLFQTATTKSTPLSQCQQSMQAFIDAWSGGLRATGGALVPSKSWIYPIEFHFNSKGFPSYKNPQEMQLQFTVKDDQNIRQTLSQIHPSEAKETLGVCLAPDGNETKQINYLSNKIGKWVDNIRTNSISKIHAYTALTTTIFKSIEYSLPTSTITEQQWKKLMAPLNAYGLQINGVCSKIPKALREGSTTHMALQIHCMYKHQEIMKLEKYLTFRENNGIVGKMIRLVEELLKVETGLPGNVFSLDYSVHRWLASESWIKSIWSFLHRYNIKLEMLTPALKETKKDDLFLMKEFVSQGYQKTKLQTLNTCRKYLQVTCLGEITNGNGSQILKSIKVGSKLTCSSSSLKWPTQTRPDESSWKIWRSALRKTFEVDGKVAPGMIRSQWMQNTPRIYHWYHDWISNCLLHRTPNNKWKMYRQSIQRGRRATFPIYHYQNIELVSLPNHARPSSILPRNPTQVIFTGSGKSPQVETPTNITDMESYIASLNISDRWVFQHSTGLENLHHVARCIQSGNCVLISDGSFDENKQQAAAAWCLGNEALHRQLKGAVLCAGQKKVHSAYRGELAGLYGGLRMIEAICKIYDIQTGRIILGCDGLGAIAKIQHSKISLSSSNYDYVSAIRSVIQHLPIHIEYSM